MRSLREKYDLKKGISSMRAMGSRKFEGSVADGHVKSALFSSNLSRLNLAPM